MSIRPAAASGRKITAANAMFHASRKFSDASLLWWKGAQKHPVRVEENVGETVRMEENQCVCLCVCARGGGGGGGSGFEGG